MRGKRKDNRGRLLKTGETQLKDGKYRFSYYENGKHKALYSWKLLPSDKTPTGKRDCPCLREKIAQYCWLKKMYEGISPFGCTVYDLVEKYTFQKRSLKPTSQGKFKTVLNHLQKDDFGKRNIKTVRTSDAKFWLINLAKEGRSYSTVTIYRSVLRLAFQIAVDDEVIGKNPFNFHLGSILKNDAVKREALTDEQRDAFLRFILNDKHYSQYYDAIYILFHTGLRISEFCGLTLSDIDLQEEVVHINHQLQRLPSREYIITSTKTSSGTRVLPLTSDVYISFFSAIISRKNPKTEPTIDGYTGFLFLDKNGMPTVSVHWRDLLHRIWKKYNSENDEPLPQVSPHVCRHTYCSSMARSGISPKILQYLMGHYEISTTLNVYTHFNLQDAQKELLRMAELEDLEE